MKFRLQYIGGPTALIEMGGHRILIDPTFDPPGDYPIGQRVLRKLTGPAVELQACLPVDIILLSHDQHPDNLDTRGRDMLAQASHVFTTAAAHARLATSTHILANWQEIKVPTVNGASMKITGVPALHGPAGSEAITGEVTGFVITVANGPTVYISGDNASLEHVRSIRKQFDRIDIAILFAGAAQTPLIPGVFLTFTSEQAAQACEILEPTFAVPLHFEHWAHFTQNSDSLRASFAKRSLSKKLKLLQPGQVFCCSE